ncbi:chemotaxis protein CheW [Geomonas sp. Red69]|uniref:Chemotaxis protein CheW n=1 Tax=Geomonas diazotrophica TaxID=2843197 RepID=A0ABX8JGN9_9BACT|nr:MULTISPECIES: chemotaxis protein CheW [Geomonas]MBU5637836.1 chemotaxis protein CheW [Geomonas diazotrophica]QWV96367.1 chemotaxis protein CheW [Geomonas nitrogeniifigens]QXE85434.1 chemotaxis protein CheW [Geomonas nitrogeniifigens]
MAEQFILPSSGLAEDVLARFIEQAQEEVDRGTVGDSLAQGGGTLQLVTFRLGKEEYGVDINSVQEIIRGGGITEVPGAPGHVSGVINLRGKIIPVVNLRRRFSRPDIEENEEQRIVVVELGEKRLGMLVDSVRQVIQFSTSLVEEMPEDATTPEASYINGMGKLDGRLIIILNLNRALLL